MDAIIYCLFDPISKEIRYVGKATDLKKRLDRHLSDWQRTHKTNWIKRLRQQGVKPEIDALEIIRDSDDQDWQKSERWWIEYLRFIGCRLTNADSGGNGGKRHSPETCRKISESNLGKKLSPSHIEKMRRANLGRKQSPEAIAKTAAAHRGVPRSAQTKARIGAANRGHPAIAAASRGRVWSAASREKLGRAFRGRQHSLEHREKNKLAHLGTKHSDEAKAKCRTAGLKRPPHSEEARAILRAKAKLQWVVRKMEGYAISESARRKQAESMKRTRALHPEIWERSA